MNQDATLSLDTDLRRYDSEEKPSLSLRRERSERHPVGGRGPEMELNRLFSLDAVLQRHDGVAATPPLRRRRMSSSPRATTGATTRRGPESKLNCLFSLGVVLLWLFAGCTLEADPSQNATAAVTVTEFAPGDPPPPSALPPLDRLQLFVIGEFGVISAEGDVTTGEFTLTIPPGPARQLQLIGERGGLPVLFGAKNADVIANQQEPIEIPTQSAAGLVTSTLDSALNLLPLDDLSLEVLNAAAGLPSKLSLNQEIELSPLPLGTYQIDPASIPSGLVLPAGEDLIFVRGESALQEREVVLFAEDEPLTISLSPEGSSLRLKILDANGLVTPFVGDVALIDQGGLLSLPPLVSFSAADNGQKLLVNVLSSTGLFGVAAISAKVNNTARSKDILPFAILDILPAGAPTRLVLLPGQATLEGSARPEPGDLLVAAVDALGRVAASSATVTLQTSTGGFLRQSTVTLSQGVGVAKRAIVPTGETNNITITASSTGLASDETTITIVNQ